MFCAFSSSSSYLRLEMSCLISFSSPGEKQASWWRSPRNKFGFTLEIYLQWSHHFLCPPALWWCSALSGASWSSVISDGGKVFCFKLWVMLDISESLRFVYVPDICSQCLMHRKNQNYLRAGRQNSSKLMIQHDGRLWCSGETTGRCSASKTRPV